MLSFQVNKATTPGTDEERRNFAQQWEQSDLENSYRQKDFEPCVRKKWETWKQEPVNIAVIGRSGVGKSRLINAIRGCTSEDDPLYANVGTTETTLEKRSYNHPNNPLLKFWDLPGIGTKAFPRKHFIKNKEIDFYSYDLYLIVSADRFMEEEEYFAEEIEKTGKTFLFVRTKADVNEEEFKDFPLELQKMRKAPFEENKRNRRLLDFE
jgi:small GTP-binding protein